MSRTTIATLLLVASASAYKGHYRNEVWSREQTEAAGTYPRQPAVVAPFVSYIVSPGHRHLLLLFNLA